MSKFEYLKLADAVAAEIANGALKPGDRLPPQRSFAYERKIAVSTASRVYTELLRRGLVVGEVGRGTFISGEARRGVAAPTEPRGARIDLEFNYPLLPTQSAMIAKSLEGLERPEALDLALRHATSIGTQARTRRYGGISRARGLVTGCGADRLHRQRQAMHRGRACRGGADRRPLRRRGADLSLHQGHRRPARRHAGAACDGRTRRSSGRGAKGPPRSASVGAVHSADDSKSAGHDDAGLAPRRSAARRREARPHRHRGYRLRLSRRRNAAGRARARPLHRARQPVEEGGAGPRARLHRFAAAPAREHHGRGSLGRLDRRGICVCRRPAADGGRHRRRTVTAETDRCRAPPADGGETPCRLRDPGEPQILPSLADPAAALALADLRRRRGAPRHRADAVDDLRRGSRACPQRRPAGARPHRPSNNSIWRCVRLREC